MQHACTKRQSFKHFEALSSSSQSCNREVMRLHNMQRHSLTAGNTVPASMMAHESLFSTKVVLLLVIGQNGWHSWTVNIMKKGRNRLPDHHALSCNDVSAGTSTVVVRECRLVSCRVQPDCVLSPLRWKPTHLHTLLHENAGGIADNIFLFSVYFYLHKWLSAVSEWNSN